MSELELTMMRRVGELKAENARLKAEVERLTKAGDAMLNFIGQYPNWKEAVRGWEAAKEGKPSA